MRFKNRWKLYEFIDKNPYKNSHDIADDMGWSLEKTSKYLHRLIDDGIIKHERFVGVDSKSGFYPTPWQELINWEEFNKDESGTILQRPKQRRKKES